MRHLLLLKTGLAQEALRLTTGDYDTWFAQALAGLPVRLSKVEPSLGEPLPRALKGFDGVLVTGSPLSLTRPVPWMEQAAELLRGALAHRVPTLGVCFGHQLLGHALGVPVIKNPRGREIGSIEVALTDAGARDPLFQGVPRRFHAQATHEDILERLPEGAALLGGNANTPLQALAFGPACRSVQFHPELSPAGMRALLEARVRVLEREAAERGEDPVQRVRGLLAGVHHTPFGRRLLHNFVAHFI